MAASREKGAGERLNEGGSARAKAPFRRRLRMPIRLLPRVGERPAGADLGVLAPRDTLLLSFVAGDLGFRIDRGRAGAPLRGLLNCGVERPSLPTGRAEAEMDLVRMKEGGFKKSLA